MSTGIGLLSFAFPMVTVMTHVLGIMLTICMGTVHYFTTDTVGSMVDDVLFGMEVLVGRGADLGL